MQGWEEEDWVAHWAQALTLQLGTFVALALAPSSADAPTAVLLLGEAGQGVAATLGERWQRGHRAPLPLLGALFPSLPALSFRSPD